MLGRKTYTQDELDNARSAMTAQIAAYQKLVEVLDTSDPAVAAALADFEPLLGNSLALVLDRSFVHRLRTVTGKDGNPLNEVELVADSLLNHGGVLRTGNVVKYIPAQSVVKLEVGDRINLTVAQVDRLAEGFFAEIDARFVTAA